mgnify:CR=1 FL=1
MTDKKIDQLTYRVSTNLKYYLSKSGKLARQAEIEVGVTESQVSNYIAGRRLPNLPNTIRLCKFLNIKLQQLLEDPDNRKPVTADDRDDKYKDYEMYKFIAQSLPYRDYLRYKQDYEAQRK